MTQTTPERKPCSVCPGEYVVTANGTIRHHFTDRPEFQASPDSRKCRGVGEPPAGAAGEQSGNGPQCRLCKHPAQLHPNDRVRSHLTPEATPRPCPGGSDFPLGMYPDMIGTTDGLVATIHAECEHVPIGQCYACYGEAGNPVSDAELNAMAEADGTGTAPWGNAELAGDGDGTKPRSEPSETITRTGANGAIVAAAPTMADQLKAAPTDDFGQPVRECFNCDAVGCAGCGALTTDDSRPEASRFVELLAQETRGAGTVADVFSPAERARLDAIVATDHRIPEQKAADVETSRLTREAVKVLQQRSPEEKAETAARMDRTASAVLGLPLDPELNHEYTDPSGTVWVHPGPEETCQAPDCVTMRSGRPEGFDPNCAKCDTDNHRCPGCGTDVSHGVVACAECTARVDAEKAERQAACTHLDGFQDTLSVDGREVPACEHCGAVGWFSQADPEPVGPDTELPNCPHPETHRAGCGCPDDDSARRKPVDGWRTPLDLMEKMPGVVRGLDALRLNCGECGHPVTPLVDTFGPDGLAVKVVWDCEQHLHRDNPCRGHECKPDTRVQLGELEVGDHFIRRGAVMRVAVMPVGGSIAAVVAEGPMRGRTGELKNWGEEVDRTHCRHSYSYADDGKFGHSGSFCDYCGAPDPETETTQEQESGQARLGDLDEGDHFIRNGTLMRLTERESSTSVLAVVIGGPHDGRTGELKNLGEMVERAPEPRTKEQETKECTDDRTATSQRSSAASTTTRTTAPVPGSRPPTKASAPAVSPKSESVTSSAPTARAAGNGRSAAVTTDQASAAAAFLGSARPAAPAASGPQNPADAAAQFLAGGSGAHGEKETKRDSFGRYLIPHPDTGKETAWTRSTTFAKSISDTYALSQWGLRMALLGATQRPDIVQRAHGKHVKADKSLLDELTAELKNAAGDKVAANLGTAMHSFTEMADRAWHSPGGPRSVLDQVPPDCREMVETYIRLLEETGLEPVPHLIEFTTVVKQYGVAGTSDNCYKVTKPLTLKIGRGEVRLSPGEYVIGDKKTGKDLDYGWQEIAIQLSTYAQGLNTAGVWDRQDEVWEPDPLSRFDKPGTKVRLDAGIVLHLPVDKEAEKQPAVYGVDLESGWNAAVLCERVRAWRKVRKLASPVMVSEAETFAPARPEPTITTRTTVRPPSLMDKARAVTSKGEASAVWKDAKTAGLPDTEVDELVAVMQSRLKELAEPGG